MFGPEREIVLDEGPQVRLAVAYEADDDELVLRHVYLSESMQMMDLASEDKPTDGKWYMALWSPFSLLGRIRESPEPAYTFEEVMETLDHYPIRPLWMFLELRSSPTDIMIAVTTRDFL